VSITSRVFLAPKWRAASGTSDSMVTRLYSAAGHPHADDAGAEGQSPTPSNRQAADRLMAWRRPAADLPNGSSFDQAPAQGVSA
jgi:hypothetical protein